MLSGKKSLWREGHWSWFSPQKHLCCLAPWTTAGPGMALSPVPEARGRAPAGGHQGHLSPVLDVCTTQQLPSLCCAHSPHLPVPTSAGTAEEQCMTLPETGAPGTAREPDPCTPAGRSPVARAGSARGTRLGCSCKHSPASGRPQVGCCHHWDHLSSSSELGSPMPATQVVETPRLRQISWSLQS